MSWRFPFVRKSRVTKTAAARRRYEELMRNKFRGKTVVPPLLVKTNNKVQSRKAWQARWKRYSLVRAVKRLHDKQIERGAKGQITLGDIIKTLGPGALTMYITEQIRQAGLDPKEYTRFVDIGVVTGAAAYRLYRLNERQRRAILRREIEGDIHRIESGEQPRHYIDEDLLQKVAKLPADRFLKSSIIKREVTERTALGNDLAFTMRTGSELLFPELKAKAGS